MVSALQNTLVFVSQDILAPVVLNRMSFLVLILVCIFTPLQMTHDVGETTSTLRRVLTGLIVTLCVCILALGVLIAVIVVKRMLTTTAVPVIGAAGSVELQ